MIEIKVKMHQDMVIKILIFVISLNKVCDTDYAWRRNQRQTLIQTLEEESKSSLLEHHT